MIIGITGTDGGGKGENVWETFARPCQLFCDVGNKIATRCTVLVEDPRPTTVKLLTKY